MALPKNPTQLEVVKEVNDKVSKTENETIAGTKTFTTRPTLNGSGLALQSEIPTVPTKTSDLTNDSGFITSASLPTKTSDLTNDSGFITSSDVPTYTAGNNITISDGVISVVGTQSGTNTFAIQGTANKSYAMAVGRSSYATAPQACAVGYNAKAQAQQALALGNGAVATATYSCQIGAGTNSTANSLQFLTTQIVNGEGKIPFANLDIGFASDNDYTAYIGEI